MKVGEWYRYRKDADWHHAYHLVAVGRDFVVYQCSPNDASFYMTRTDFDAQYELIAEDQ